jgi:maleylacetoacetate isomerase
VRIALNLKGLPYEQRPVDLRAGAQRDPEFLRLNPQGLVPTLVGSEGALAQSMAIMEWLEETAPEPPLLPRDPFERAQVRAMAALIACDIHPLNNLRVLQSLRRDLGADEAQVSAWIARWITQGYEALEPVVRAGGGDFCFGETPTLADCCLVPQIYSAERFAVDLSPYPALLAVAARAADHPAFAAAHPSRQPDADAG